MEWTEDGSLARRAFEQSRVMVERASHREYQLGCKNQPIDREGRRKDTLDSKKKKKKVKSSIDR